VSSPHLYESVAYGGHFARGKCASSASITNVFPLTSLKSASSSDLLVPSAVKRSSSNGPRTLSNLISFVCWLRGRYENGVDWRRYSPPPYSRSCAAVNPASQKLREQA
jgi:hypothetical protein